MNTEKSFNWIMTTAVLLVLAIPVGIANLYLGFYIGESPCTLCWFERIGMIVIGTLGIFMLRYGPKIKYIAWVFLFAAYGIYMGLRHTSTHWARDIGMGNGDKLFGAHTYTWAIVVYWIVVIFMALMLFFITHRSTLMAQMADAVTKVKKLSVYAKIVVILSFLVVCSNAFQALYLNGIPPYTGKGNPDRFSTDFTMMKRTWTTGVWDRLKHWNPTGKNVIEDPYIKDLSEPKDVKINPNFADGAFEKGEKLTVYASQPIDLKEISSRTTKPIMAMARNEKNGDIALLTHELGNFFVDPDLGKVNGFVVYDKPNASDMKYVVGGAFVGDKLVTIAFNKVIVSAQKTDKPIDDLLEWRTFRETSGGIAPTFGKARKNMQSIRGKYNYVNNLASDGRYIYTVTIPNRWNKKVILQKFDTKDWALSAETVLLPSGKLAVKEKRNLQDYYVSGLTYHDGKLYAMSPQYSSILVIDPQTAGVVDVYEVEGLSSPRSLFVKDGEFNILDRKDGKDMIVKVRMPEKKAA